MPIYEYQCANCGHRFEFFQSIKDAPMTVCPNCQGALKKLLSPAGIIFKGSGWYKTDSRATPSESKPAEATTNGKADGAEKASGESSKPATESSSKPEGSASSKNSTASKAD